MQYIRNIWRMSVSAGIGSAPPRPFSGISGIANGWMFRLSNHDSEGYDRTFDIQFSVNISVPKIFEAQLVSLVTAWQIYGCSVVRQISCCITCLLLPFHMSMWKREFFTRCFACNDLLVLEVLSAACLIAAATVHSCCLSTRGCRHFQSTQTQSSWHCLKTIKMLVSYVKHLGKHYFCWYHVQQMGY